MTTIGIIQERLKDALSTFFASSPFFQNPGQDFRVYEDGNDVVIRIDESDDLRDACCIIKIHIHGGPRTTIVIELSEVRLLNRGLERCRRGGEYLAIVNDMLDRFFTHSNETFREILLLSTVPTKVYFQVTTDASQLHVIPDIEITSDMKKFTEYVALGKTARYRDESTKDFRHLKFKDLPVSSITQSDSKIADFWNFVVRHDPYYPEALYEKTIRMSHFADLVLNDYEYGHDEAEDEEVEDVDENDEDEENNDEDDDEDEEDDEEDDDEDEEDEEDEVDEFHALKHMLLCKIWYQNILPQLMYNFQGWADVQQRQKHQQLFVEKLSFEKYPLDLGLVTLLSREERKTWYMIHLNLSPCLTADVHPERTRLDDMVKRFQNEPFLNVVPKSIRYYFNSPRNAPLTTKQVILEGSRRLSYYDILRLKLIHHDKAYFSKLGPYFLKVCRVLIRPGDIV